MESLGDIPSLLLVLGLNSIRMEQTAKGPGQSWQKQSPANRVESWISNTPPARHSIAVLVAMLPRIRILLSISKPDHSNGVVSYSLPISEDLMFLFSHKIILHCANVSCQTKPYGGDGPSSSSHIFRRRILIQLDG